MKDMLHIVELLKQHAETDLAVATRRKTEALANIEMIETNIIDIGKTKSGQMDGLVYEQWCVHQRETLEELRALLPNLDESVRHAFSHLETVQAKFTAVESLAAKHLHQEKLKAEGVEEDAMLELTLLRRAQE